MSTLYATLIVGFVFWLGVRVGMRRMWSYAFMLGAQANEAVNRTGQGARGFYRSWLWGTYEMELEPAADSDEEEEDA